MTANPRSWNEARRLGRALSPWHATLAADARAHHERASDPRDREFWAGYRAGLGGSWFSQRKRKGLWSAGTPLNPTEHGIASGELTMLGGLTLLSEGLERGKFGESIAQAPIMYTCRAL